MGRTDDVTNRLTTEACDTCGATPATRQFHDGRATDEFACAGHATPPSWGPSNRSAVGQCSCGVYCPTLESFFEHATTRHLADRATWRKGTTLVDKPGLEELEEWMTDGGCEATDGCWVEPDGECEHDHKSWMQVLGLI